MREILYISDIESDPDLELAKQELAHYSYSLSVPVAIVRALDYVRGYSQVLINARDSKLAALELVKNIRDVYKGAVKVFVYLPKSGASEGSKFGHYGAEVEDEHSVQAIVDKLPQAAKRDYVLDEDIIAVHAMHGGAGASLLSILLSYSLGKSGYSSLLMELSPATTSIRDILALDTQSTALLSRDRTKEQDLSRDSDWFSGYVSRSYFLTETFYLHLFESAVARDLFGLKAANFATKISDQLSTIAERSSYYQHNSDELAAALRAARNGLQLLSQELSGSAYSLFDEVLQPGSQLAKHFVVDLGTDISSPLNRQFLKFTKHLIIMLRDNHGSKLKETVTSQINYIKDNYDCNIIPVLAPGHHRYQDYNRLTASEWQSLLGFEPMILPYEPDLVSRFLMDHEELEAKSSLMRFCSDLLARTGQVEAKSRKGLMDFLVRNT